MEAIALSAVKPGQVFYGNNGAWEYPLVKLASDACKMKPGETAYVFCRTGDICHMPNNSTVHITDSLAFVHFGAQ